MSEWKTYKLRDVVNILDYKRIPLSSRQREQRRGKYPYYGAQGIIDYIDDYIFDGTYLLVAEDGENLRSKKQHIAQLVSGKYWVNNHAHILESNGLCDIRYICYLLNVFDISGYITGSAQPKLNQANLLAIEISLPPLAEQKRIADILSAIDDKIELNRRINANLEQQAQALYKSWFVDFEPWGGVMPKDWREGTISDIVDLLNGFAFKSSDFVEKGLYKLITIKGVQDGNMSLNGADCLDIIPPKMPQWCKLKKEDILLSLTGNVGRCCLVDTENCLLNQRVAKLHPKEEYNRLFVYALFRQEDMKARMISIARGTAQMNLSPIETGKLPLIIPSNEVLKDFGNRFNNIIHTLTNNIVESSYLAQLRDTLLPKLMSGEITV